MKRSMKLWLLAILVLLFGGGAALAQDTAPAPRIDDVPRITTEIRYGGSYFELNEADGSVAIGYVESRTTTAAGATLDIVLFVHDSTGWRAVGHVTGAATGPLVDAVPGSVLTLAVVSEAGQ